MTDYDVIIIGGGISGLLSALTLSRHGKSVLVLEKNDVLGGNCNSYMVDGFQVDTGPHAITHLREGPLRRLMDEYFTYIPVFLDYGTYYVRTEKGLTKIPSNIQEFVTFDVLPRKDRLLLSQALTKALTLNAFGMLDGDQSVYAALPRGLSRDTLEFVDAIAPFLSGKSMKETSVNRVLYGSSFVRDSVSEDIFKDETAVNGNSYAAMLTGKLSKYQLTARLSTLGRLATNRVSYSQAYPRGGLKSLLNAVLHSIPADVRIMKGARAGEILTASDGRATGVATDTDSFTADTVIYTGFAKQLPSLLKLPDNYRDDLSRIEQTLSLTIWLGLSKKMKEFDYQGSEVWFRNGAYWAMPISNYDPCIAPEGKQLVGFTFVIDEKDIESEKKRALELIFRAVPGIEDRVEMVHHQVTIPEKAAVTINGYFAQQRSPVANLYLAGTDTDNRSMGVTRAAYSVLELRRVLKEDKKL